LQLNGMPSAKLALVPPRNSKMDDFLQACVLERRSKVRFPLELRVRYRSLARRCPTAGTGMVMNMSRSGVLVSSEHDVSEGVRIELNIEWPSLLDGRVPLQVVTVGRVVRCEPSSFAVVLAQYQFRTTRTTELPIQLVGGAC
jgi:hypothetical protein